MKRSRSNKVPVWKQSIGWFIALYFLLTLFIPMLIQVVIGILPFMHSLNIGSRFLISLINMLFICSVLFFLSINRSSEKNTNYRDRIAITLGAIFFSFMIAWDSPIFLGMFTKVLPSSHFEEQVVIKKTNFYKSHNVSLELEDVETKQSYYLVLTSRLFNYRHLKVGDKIKLDGNQTIIGPYVTSFEVLGSQRD